MSNHYKKYAEIIKEKINLETSPTAIKIYEKEEEAQTFNKIEDNIMHCQAIITAGKGNTFYATKKRTRMPLWNSNIRINKFSR
ncbi:DUF169 domain-containing protein [Methanosphaera sp. ISO3-F5]|uniref:DUF169 domain-containing protein n=1 Tax=Methanosphaera sp. ISO3-F5 TaxID=1452353 RepID=UPI002B25AE69|nr:DUF169 domain-containing protein [Methanosphaera sp. ISO3-F5]WQH63993.1 DUF169 domain-containing protein [Methanosphaera sp. ISO3-F5]